MSKFTEIQQNLSNCLKNDNKVCFRQLFEGAPNMLIDAYLKQKKHDKHGKYAKVWALRHFYTNDITKPHTVDFLSDKENLVLFLTNQDLLNIALENVCPERFIQLIKQSGILFNGNWHANAILLASSQQITLQGFYQEATFLHENHAKIKTQAQSATNWLNQIDWHTFWVLFAYEFTKQEQHLGDPNMVRTGVQPFFFMLQHKLKGSTTLDRGKIMATFHHLNSQEPTIKVGLLFQNTKAWKENELAQLGYVYFQDCLNQYSYLSQAEHYLEQYCYTDNIAIDFAQNNTVGRVYLKSVEKAIEARKDLLKYSLCSRYYNAFPNTPFENHREASCMTSYFEDLGFDVKSDLKLKNGETICIEILANIIASLRKGNSLDTVFTIVSQSEFIRILKNAFGNKYSDAVLLKHINFIAIHLPFQKDADILDIGSIPIYKLGGFYILFPRYGALSADFNTGLLNLLWRNLADDKKKYGVDEIKKVSDKQAHILQELFEKNNFKVIANEKIEGIEFDLVAYHDGVLFLIEMKSTCFQVYEKGVHLHQKEAIVKANEQLNKRLSAIIFEDKYQKTRDRLGIPKNKVFIVPCFKDSKLSAVGFKPKTTVGDEQKITLLPIALSTSFDFDHTLNYIDGTLVSLKMSYFELLVTLRNDREKLFNENRIREKIMMLLDKEPILKDFNFEKIANRTKEFQLFKDAQVITGKEIWDNIWLNFFWSDWLGDNFDFIKQDYISPRKTMDIICTVNTSNANPLVANFNDLYKFSVYEALQICTDLLALFPNDTSALFERGKIFTILKEYGKAIADFEAIFQIDLVEAIQPNPNLMSALEGVNGIHINRKEYQKAIDFMERLVNAYPKFYHGYLILEEFERLHGSPEKAKEWKQVYLNNLPISDYPSRLKQAIYEKHNR